jgi:hypothetical protein
MFIYSTLHFARVFAFAFCFRLATSFVVPASRSCMVHIKFTARPRTPAVSPKFSSMASDEALIGSTRHKETSTKQVEESEGGQHVVISTEATLEQGAGSDQEIQSEGCGNGETTSYDGGLMKIGAKAALPGISYDFGQSTITRACLASLEGVTHYFLKGYAQPHGAKSIPNLHENEMVVFEDFFTAGLRMPLHPVLLDILRKF